MAGEQQPVQSVSEWLRHKVEYTSSIAMSSVQMAMEAGDLPGVISALARIAEREERLGSTATVDSERFRAALERIANDAASGQIITLHAAVQIAQRAINGD